MSFGLITSVLIFSSAQAAPQGFCISDPEQDLIFSYSKGILSSIELDNLNASPQEFCDEHMAKRYLLGTKKVSRMSTTYAPDGTFLKAEMLTEAMEYASAEEVMASKARNEIKKLLTEKVEARGRGPAGFWDASLIPLESLRTPDYDGILRGFQDYTDNSRAILQMRHGVSYGALETENRCKLVFNPPLPDSVRDIQPIKFSSLKSGKESLAKRYGCAELEGLLFSGSCGESAAVVERIVAPYSMPPITLIGREIYENVLRDHRYDEGLRLAALKLMKMVKEGGETGKTLQNDLRDSFVEAGATTVDAEEMAWNVLGLIGTAGPDLVRRLTYMKKSQDEDQKILSLSVVAASLPLLDHRSSREGHVYSFPESVKVSCNTGKPYHFWFTAYIARRAAIETGSPKPAAAMAFQAAKAYHIVMRPRTLVGNEDGKMILPSSQELFTSASQIVRADLAYASAGAVFGANAAGDRSAKLDIDKTLGILVKGAGEGGLGALGALGEWVGGDLAKAYGNWIEKFNANQAFFVDRKAGFPKKVNKKYLKFEEGRKEGPGCP